MPSAISNSPAAQALLLRCRPDLVFAAPGDAESGVWTVKDPVSLRYFQLQPEEYAVLRMLDGRISVAELCRRFGQRFVPQELTPQGLQHYLARLHELGLLLADAPDQGAELLARRNRREQRQWLTLPLRWLAIRWRGFDPQSLLDRLQPLGRVLFSPGLAALALIFGFAAVSLLTTQFDEVRRKLPEAAAFFNGSNAFGLLAAMVVLKVCHEFGHALACRRFGGECHEMGVYFVAGIPCLYCNVSDAWLWPERGRRMLVSAAGIYLELLIATACVFLWWASEPGWLHAACLNIVFVASVGTVLVNGNPLLRYDGYYILSDLTATPNLWQQSQQVVRSLAARCCLGLRLPRDRSLRLSQKLWLALYGLSALAYRAVVMVSLLALVYHVLAGYRLQAAAQVLVGLTVIGLALGPSLAASRLLKDPLRREQLRRGRVLLSFSLVLLVLAGICFTPLPYRVRAWAVVEPASAQRMYITVPGTLRMATSPGERVAAGTPLAQLENPELEMELARLISQRERQRLLVDSLQARRLNEQLPAAQAALADLEQQLARRRADLAELQVVSPTAGIVLPPPLVARTPASPGELHDWQGTPLEARNRGAYLTTGTLLCLVGEPQQLEAILAVPQEDVELVGLGQTVRLQLDEFPAEIIAGEVLELARVDLKLVPRELTAAGKVALREDSTGERRPLETWYQARVKFTLPGTAPLLRSGGEAKILVAPRSLAWRMWRYLERTFRLSGAA